MSNMADAHNNPSDNEDESHGKLKPSSPALPAIATKLSTNKRPDSLVIHDPKRRRTAPSFCQQDEVENLCATASPAEHFTSAAPAARGKSLEVVNKWLSVQGVKLTIDQQAAVNVSADDSDGSSSSSSSGCMVPIQRAARNDSMLFMLEDRVRICEESNLRLEHVVEPLLETTECLDDQVCALQESNQRLYEHMRTLQESHQCLNEAVNDLTKAVNNLQRRRYNCHHAQESERCQHAAGGERTSDHADASAGCQGVIDLCSDSDSD